MIGVRDNCTGSGLDFGGQELDKNDGDGDTAVIPRSDPMYFTTAVPLVPLGAILIIRKTATVGKLYHAHRTQYRS